MPLEVVRERMLTGLHARGYTDLTPAHLNVLQHPGPHKVRPSELAARTGMTKQALNYLLGQMEHRGYLRRRDDAGDQRSKRIHLTARGDRAIDAIREVVAEVEAEWEQQLGAGQFEDLHRTLTHLNALRAAPHRVTPVRAATAAAHGAGWGRPVEYPTAPFAPASDEGERLVLGDVTVLIKVSCETAGGAFTIFEEGPPLLNTPRHIHANEDEVFHAVEGEHVVECGDAEFRLGPGGLILGPDSYAAASEQYGITWLA